MQFAFSTAATARWLVSAKYYLLGFLGFENSIFAQALLGKLKPKAKVYVIAIDDFFEPSERPLAKIVMHAGEGRPRYEVKRLLQVVHKAMCGKLTKICGGRCGCISVPPNGDVQYAPYEQVQGPCTSSLL